MKTIGEVSRLTGLTQRTLRHFDAIGLLEPTEVTGAGYRLYNDEALARLQSILFFRELRFPLKDIKEILDRPGFDPQEALKEQLKLLELERERLDKLITLACETLEKGGKPMSFMEFDRNELEEYAAEAKARWGSSEPYQEFRTKTKGQSETQMLENGQAIMEIFQKLGEVKDQPPENTAVQALIAHLQATISQLFYHCTPTVLAGLGEMYVADRRMKANIDKAGGEGTAAFAQKAIQIYCRQKN